MWIFWLFCLCLPAQITRSAFISWDGRGNMKSEEEIYIRRELLRIPGKERFFGQRIKKLRNITSLPLDTRCELGLPMSISWHIHEPYSGIHQTQIKKSFSFVVFGIFPAVINEMLKFCCHSNASIIIGKLRRSAREAEEEFVGKMYDFTMPLYGSSWKTSQYREKPFIPVVQAPYVMLIVYDGGERTKTWVLAKSILSAWPFLVFIVLATMCAGFVVWGCEKQKNSEEFSSSWLKGSWEGIWWAFVTMTTVGYGDRSPLTIPGRLFCILWIIFGISMVSIFTGIITAAITASTTPYFNIHGAKIGAVNGSEEYRLGVTLHANMKAYSLASQMTADLTNRKLDGALLDNFSITRFSALMKEDPIRVERIIKHPITYGFVLPDHGPKTEACFRKYLDNYRQDAFEKIAKFLKPLKNPTDDINKQVETVRMYFHQEEHFDTILYSGLIFVGTLMSLGFLWEIARWAFIKAKGIHGKQASTRTELSTFLPVDHHTDLSKRKKAKQGRGDLCREFKSFQTGWLRQLDALSPTASRKQRKIAYRNATNNNTTVR